MTNKMNRQLLRRMALARRLLNQESRRRQRFARQEGRPPMLTLLEQGLVDIDRRMIEQHARMEEARQALAYLQEEKEKIIKDAVEAAAKAARDEVTRTPLVD
jgi:hypothetical protein